MFYTIYKTTCKINGKIYIGKHQTHNLNDGYVGSGKHLRRAIRKYGKENFVTEILHVFSSEEEMNAKERLLVTQEFCSRQDTYNICEGGKGGWGYVNTLERNWTDKSVSALLNWKARASFDEISKAAKASAETRKRIGLSFPRCDWTGYKHKSSTRDKLSLIMREKTIGEKNSQFGTVWITNGVESKKIRLNDAIPEGWRRGRSHGPVV